MAKKIFSELKQLISLRSLRARICIIILVAGVFSSVFMRYGILDNYEELAVENRIATVSNQLMIVGNHLLSNSYFTIKTDERNYSSSRAVINAELETISNLYEGRVMIINAALKVVKVTYGSSEGKTIISEEVVKSFQGEEINKYDSKNRYIELAIPLKKEGMEQSLGVLLVSVSTDSIMLNYDYLKDNALILELASMVIILGFALFWSGRLVRPFGKLTKYLEGVQAGDEETLMISDYTETQAISDAFNELWGKMRVIDDSRQEFVSNVSHELKTPLTSMKVLADSLLAQGDAPVELYKEFMGDIAEEIERENKIINDLLSLVKMDKAAGTLNVSVVNINELLELILKRLRPIAEKQNIELVLESFRPVSAEVDEVKLSLALNNLVENAIKYNKPEGWVHVSLNADHKYFFVRVEDSGIGIPEEALEHIYERFFRADKSHSREIGGTGLGLAITRNAVLMHRGAIKAHSKEGEGTVFTVRIPLMYIV